MAEVVSGSGRGARTGAAGSPPPELTPPVAGPAAPAIARGTGYVMFAYDVGFAIDLDAAERAIVSETHREQFRRKRKTPAYFQYQPPPVRVTQACEPIQVAGYAAAGTVDAVIYDFGAVSVTYSFPLAGPLERLRDLSDALYDNATLLDHSRRLVEQLVATMGPAISRPHISELVEDYAVHLVEALAPAMGAYALLDTHGALLAQILRSEQEPLSADEVADALHCHVSFGPQDLVVMDWNAALLFDTDADDTRAVLEYANVELLEMRYLDEQLDKALDESYRTLSRQSWRLAVVFDSTRAELRRIAQLQMDNALLFEGVNNALKLLGDQYLARVYRLVAQRLHLGEWDTSILRKLHTLESVYEKVSSLAAHRRSEMLEWIIILLIALSIGLELLALSGE